MIKLEKAEKYRHCNSCNSEGTVYNVTVLNRLNQGTQIALCLDCLEEAVSMGKMVLNSKRNVKTVIIDEIEG